MIKQYFKQAINLIGQNKLLSAISIIGTAFAIAMIMCIVLVYQARTANYEPEVNRDRTLSVNVVIATGIEDEGWNNGGRLSLQTIKTCFYPLTNVEAVSAVSAYETKLAATPGGTVEKKCFVSFSDTDFWKVFQFHFLSGKPYSEADFASGVKSVVICRSLAREIFGTEDVVGRTLSLSYDDYTVCGVVADVSVLTEEAYAQAWAPFTTKAGYEYSYSDGLEGSYQCYILARSTGDFDAIRTEVNRNVERMNSSQKVMKLRLFGAPDSQLMSMARKNSFSEPDVPKLVGMYILLIVILLLVPAINLSGITLSRMRKRMQEIGVRRAFGATRGELLWQILSENLVLTLISGVVGLVFSFVSIAGMREWLLSTKTSGYLGADIDVESQMMFSPEIFLYAFLFCLLMNLLSAGLPAWRVSRAKIINALNS